MAHEITVRQNGTAEAAFAMMPAWHGLGAVLDHPMSSREALTAAQLDWLVVQQKLGRFSEHTDGGGEWREIHGMKANVRGDTGLFLGTVSDAYKVVQNTEAFEFLDALVTEGQMTYESAFSLSGGRKVVLLGRLPGVDQVVEGDDLLRYVLLSLCHDGTGAIKFGPTSTRVVCANTYRIALDKDGDRMTSMDELSISHMGDVRSKLERAREILTAANQQFDVHAAASRELAKRKLSVAEWMQYLDIMCPELDEHDPDWTERRADAIARTRLSVRAAYHNERQSIEGIEHSAWAAFNAVVEHIDHLPRRGATRQQKAEARFNVCLYGAGRDMKRRAFDAACRFAGLAV